MDNDNEAPENEPVPYDPTDVENMTDRDLLKELVTFTRETRVAIANTAESLSGHPMLKMFGGSLGSLFGGK